MKEIKLDIVTINVPSDDSYSLNDMKKMFGKRIRKAINNKPDLDKRIYEAIIAKKKCRKFADVGNSGMQIFAMHIKNIQE